MVKLMRFIHIRIASFWPERRMRRTMRCHRNKRVSASEMCQIRRNILTELSHKLRKQSLTRQAPH
jgi:hypothetical protein